MRKCQNSVALWYNYIQLTHLPLSWSPTHPLEKWRARRGGQTPTIIFCSLHKWLTFISLGFHAYEMYMYSRVYVGRPMPFSSFQGQPIYASNDHVHADSPPIARCWLVTQITFQFILKSTCNHAHLRKINITFSVGKRHFEQGSLYMYF